MRIVHGSDWHGEMQEVPEADLYLFTGDMLPNFPVQEMDASFRYWSINPQHEVKTQAAWLSEFYANGGMLRYLGNNQAPVICVRGNHDFTDLGPLFRGCNSYELKDNELVNVLGLKISGHRGIPWIYGTWNDEYRRPDLMDRVRAIPEGIDILLTHYPPALVLDMEVERNGRVNAYGLEGMLNHVMEKVGKLHCFGHIHGAGGRTERIDNVLFSNAATTYNVIDI